MLSRWTIARIRGVPVELHASLVLGALVVALGGAGGIPESARGIGLDPSGVWLNPLPFGLLLAAGFVVSVALHELAHLASAHAVGAHASRMTFTVVGGASKFSGARGDPWSSGLIEAAGPATSLFIGLLCVVGFRWLPARPADLRLLAFDLAQLNLVLAVLNLIPASPLDGGRVLRALLGPKLGAERAARVELLAGRVLAALLFAAGVFEGAPVLLLLAVFVLYAATAEGAEAAPEQPARALRVGEVMVTPPRPIPAEASLDALERRLHREHLSGILVSVDERIVGAVGLTRLAEVLPQVRPQTRVEEIMAAPLPAITRTMLLEAAVRHMERLRVELLPVVEGGRIVGVVKRELPRVGAIPVAPHAQRPVVLPAPSVQQVD